MSQKSFAKEFQTIKLKGPRRSGHDYAVCNLIEKKLKNDGVMYISPNKLILEIVRDQLQQDNLDKNVGLYYVEEWIERMRKRQLDRNIKAIIVNPCDFVSRTTIEKIYDFSTRWIGIEREFYFIFMG